MEKVLCAAIWFKNGKTYSARPVNISDGLVLLGYRHPDIKRQVSDLNIQDISTETEEGFITSHNRFVSRTEAAEIALASGQMVGRSITSIAPLSSEDLY